MATSDRLIVVSNRLPLVLRKVGDAWRSDRATGGLATALTPILERDRGLWIGWPGESPRVPDPRREEQLERWRERYGYVIVDLPREVGYRFYEGYANQTLWPLFHNFPTNVEFDASGWEAYLRANELFRDAVLEQLLPGDLVWIHDYHLMLLPRLLREAAPDTRIGFFLHIPFPASEVFRILPRRGELLHGLLGADLLGFQTHADLQHFRQSLLRILGIDSRMDRVAGSGRGTRLEPFPIGIAPAEFTGLLAKDRETRAALAEHRQRFKGRKVLIAVDRMDYTKGIPHRLRTFRRLLQNAPGLRGKVVLVQVAVPSRERIPRYEELRHQVSEMVGDINGEFGTPDWTPLVYMRRGISRSDLVALYAAADVGWVTPLRDGMNLVAKEYVACQTDGDGVLVLSEFAGAAAEMGEAFLVNPYDEEGTAGVLEHVLGLGPEERRERMDALRARVLRNNVFAWAERYLSSLREAAGERTRRPPESPALPVELAVSAFRAASCPVLFLDYDGTLVPYANTPREARPPRAVLTLLGRLAASVPGVVALVSGRPRRDLEGWFGGIEGLWLAAEHGALLRSPRTRSWEPLNPGMPTEWKARVRPVLEHFVDRTPGSLIEEKEYSLVWHYRMSDPIFSEWLANELVANLEEMLAETELRAVRGKKSVEVRLTWATKAEVVARLESVSGRPDFLLALGDDRTDEDLFERLPPESWTIHVGEGPSHARFRLPDPAAVRRLLEEIAQAAIAGTAVAAEPMTARTESA